MRSIWSKEKERERKIQYIIELVYYITMVQWFAISTYFPRERVELIMLAKEMCSSRETHHHKRPIKGMNVKLTPSVLFLPMFVGGSENSYPSLWVNQLTNLSSIFRKTDRQAVSKGRLLIVSKVTSLFYSIIRNLNTGESSQKLNIYLFILCN